MGRESQRGGRFLNLITSTARSAVLQFGTDLGTDCPADCTPAVHSSCAGCTTGPRAVPWLRVLPLAPCWYIFSLAVRSAPRISTALGCHRQPGPALPVAGGWQAHQLTVPFPSPPSQHAPILHRAFARCAVSCCARHRARDARAGSVRNLNGLSSSSRQRHCQCQWHLRSALLTSDICFPPHFVIQLSALKLHV